MRHWWGGLSAAALQEAVAQGLARCKAYGLETEYQMGAYLRLRVQFGNGFDAIPAISELFEARELDPDAKVEIAEEICKSLRESRA